MDGNRLVFYAGRYRSFFKRGTRSVFLRCEQYLKGLFHECKSNIERMTERVPGAEYEKMQYFISESNWDAIAVMDEVARQTVQTFDMLPASDRGLIIDESGWEKAGHDSAGVAIQYIGNVGKKANGQVGVFCALTQSDYVGIIGGRLYLPKEWTDNKERCKKAGIPENAQVYKSKPELACEIIEEAPSELTYEWVGGDCLYGNSPVLRKFLYKRKQAFVLDISQILHLYLCDPEPYIPEKPKGAGRVPIRYTTNQKSYSLDDILKSIPEDQWQTIHHRDGEKGPLVRQAVKIDVWIWAYDDEQSPEAVQLLISREEDGTKIKFSVCWQPEGEIELSTALARQMARYWVERSFQDAKEQLGLEQYQVRVYKAWYHHVVLTMMALHFIIHTRIEDKDEISMLSTGDVKLALAHTLEDRLSNPAFFLKAMLKRHAQRFKARVRYYLKI